MNSSPSLPALTLVLGGQRSGKSAYAEALIGNADAVYLATCPVRDDGMAGRIEQHRKRRPDNWQTFEEPTDLAAALGKCDKTARPVLVDSLGMWVANLLEGGCDVEAEISVLVDALKTLTYPVVVVSEETGLGIIPDNALARDFIDALGLANQTLGAQAGRVVFVAKA